MLATLSGFGALDADQLSRSVEAVPWFGLMAPAGTPPAIVDRLHRETVRVPALPDVRKRFEELGLDVIGSSPAELAAAIKSETPHWAKVIKEAGIKLSE